MKNKIVKMKSKNVFVLIITILIISGLFSFLFIIRTNNEGKDITEQCVRHGPKGIHLHPRLEIKINEDNFIIPKDIGIVSFSCMRPLHTHDESGVVDNRAVIHVESKEIRSFALSEFFIIWDKPFNSTCIFDYCTDKGELKMFVNEKENLEFGNYTMQDEDNIRIEYTTMGAK
ncbi:hypothetical protein HQ489_06065 [Candidatus Woesearchaeota archaeon]|nr:hypothetical protein [Candidatus Woesearchaeota archaeon]